MQTVPDVIEALALYVGVPLATIIGVIAAVQQLEPHLLSPYRRARLGRLLTSRAAPHDQRTPIADALRAGLNFFDVIFGRNHWTLRCAAISALFTIVFSVTSILLIYPIDRVGYWAILQTILVRPNLFFIASALIANIVLDYLSLWETRFVLSFMRKENSARHALFLMIVDVLFTLFIFISMLALFKTILDMYFLIPLIHKYDVVTVHSMGDMAIKLGEDNDPMCNFLLYYVSMIKLNIYSMIKVLEHFLEEYWFLSLVLNERPLYYVPGSTMWATTHLASIFIYIYLVLWLGATRLMIFKAIKIPRFSSMRVGKLVIRLNFNADEYPLTIITINMIFYIGIFYGLAMMWN